MMTMKKALLIIAFLFPSLPAVCQNTTTVSGSNIMDLNGAKLANGQICFLGTDQTDTPISFQAGGGGQVLKRQFCSTVTAGVISSFTVPNPANTLPSGIYYRVMVKDGATGLEVLRYTLVTFTGATFNFDNYTPNPPGFVPVPLSGTSVTGSLGVTGNISATGTVTASNIPPNILQQVFNQGTGLMQRTALNCLAGLVCSDNAGTARTDMRLGTSTTVTFSATPAFDASTAVLFKLTLTGNVTSSTLANAAPGQPVAFELCQDSIGGRTFVAPANVVGFVTIPSSANACILETFIYDGTNALADQDVASQLKGPEAAAPAGIANFELLYADSTAHRWKMINNNGTADTVAGLADFASPPAIGATTPNSGAFSTITATGTITAAGLTASGNITAAGTITSTSANGWTVGSISNAPRVLFNSGNAGFAYEFINGSNAIEGLQIFGVDAFESGGPATGGAAGHAALWADSTSHFWKAKNNAGAAYNLVGDATTQTLTNKTLTSPSITTPTVTSPTINTGVSQGSGFKHQRFGATCTTPASAGQTCFTTFNWATPFADANYTPVCVGVGPSNGTASFNIQNWTSTGIQIILTSTGLANTFGGVDCVAFHD
jgi:hypothetical protein